MRRTWRRPATVWVAALLGGSWRMRVSNSGADDLDAVVHVAAGGRDLGAAGEGGGDERGEDEHAEGDRDHRDEQPRPETPGGTAHDAGVGLGDSRR